MNKLNELKNYVFSYLQRKTVRNTFIYIAGGFVTRSVSYLLMPVLTRYLSPADYGVVYVFNSIMYFFLPIVGFQADTYIAKHYFELEKPVLAEHIGGAIKVITIFTLITALLLFTFSGAVKNLLSLDVVIVIAALMVSAATIIGTLLLVIYQVQNKAHTYVLIVIVSTVLSVLISLLLVIVFKMGWKGRIIGLGIPIVLQALFALFALRKWEFLTIKFNFAYIRNILMFGTPLILGSFGNWIINLADKLFIAKMVSISATGIYGIAASMGMVMGVLSDSFCRAWMPYFYKNIGKNDPESNKRIVKYTYAFIIIMMILAVVITLFSCAFIKYFLAKEFSDSYKYVIWICMGQGLGGITSIFAYYLIYSKKNIVISYISIGAAVLSITLNYTLISMFGTVGAAYTIFTCSLAVAMTTIFMGIKYYKMPWLYFLKPAELA